MRKTTPWSPPRLRTAQAQDSGRLLAWGIFKDIFQEKKKIERNPTPLHGKNTPQRGIKGNFLTLMKGICRKSQRTADSVNGERLNALSLRSGTKQGCLLWPLLFNILEVLADRQVKERKGLQIGGRESVPGSEPLGGVPASVAGGIQAGSAPSACHSPHAPGIRIKASSKNSAGI